MLFGILLTAFILALIGPFITTGLFTATGLYGDFDIALFIFEVSLFSAALLLPMLGFTFFNALGCFIFWMITVEGPESILGVDMVKIMLIAAVTFILLLLPVIGMFLIKKSPKLFRAFVYIPLIVSPVIKIAIGEPFMLMTDFIYLGLVAILDVLVDRY